MKQMMTVFKFEFATFARSATYIAVTVLMVAIALIGPAVPRIIQLFNEAEIGRERTLAVVDETGAFDASFVNHMIMPEAVDFAHLSDARTAMMNGEVQYIAHLQEGQFWLIVDAMGVGALGISNDISRMMRDHYRYTAFAELGINPATQDAIFAFNPLFEIITLDAAGAEVETTAEDFFSNMILSYVLSFVLYFGLLIGGGYIVTSVVREKSTKTMELLITSCKASKLMNGKVLGVSTAVLTQIVLLVVAAFISMRLFADVENELFNISFDLYIMGMLVVFFILGFLMYAYIYAALASTVSRMEDANAIQSLPMMLIMVGFFGAIFGMTNSGATWVIVLSHVPIFAPFLMFMRICLGSAANWEVALSIMLQMVAVAGIAGLGVRIYRMGTLMYGNKPKLKDIIVGVLKQG